MSTRVASKPAKEPPLQTREGATQGGGRFIEILHGDDARVIARLTVHETEGTKLWRKFEFGLLTREDGRKPQNWWHMRTVYAVARLLRRSGR